MKITVSAEEIKDILEKAFDYGHKSYYECKEESLSRILEDFFEFKKEKVNIVYSDKENIKFNYNPTESSEIIIQPNENFNLGYYDYCMPSIQSAYSTTTSCLDFGQIVTNSNNITLLN